MTIVHIDVVIEIGLVPHLDHPDILIGVIHLRYIIVRVEITVHQIRTTTIGIDSTILVIMIGDTITQMVSHQLGAIVRIITLINIKIGHFHIASRVTIIVTDQIIITTMVMIGTSGPNILERVSSATNSSSITIIKLDEITMITQHRLVGMIGIWVIQTITLLLPSLMCQIL